ncbi:MAG: hypothetical protein ACR2PH_05905, partial [Desulfobulbia bacterium]
ASVLFTSAIDRLLDGIVFALFAAFLATIGQIPHVEGEIKVGLAIAGGLNFLIFSMLLTLLFLSRSPLDREETLVSRCVDWFASKGGTRLNGLRRAIRDGIVWPRQHHRQIGAVLASILMKIISATHFLWAGLAIGLVLMPFDYLYLMVFAGFSLILARFVRLPGGFVLGSAFALDQLGVPDEQALAMILFNQTISVILMVGPGLLFMWKSGINIREARRLKV